MRGDGLVGVQEEKRRTMQQMGALLKFKEGQVRQLRLALGHQVCGCITPACMPLYTKGGPRLAR